MMLAAISTPAAAHQERLSGGEWVLKGATGNRPASIKFEAGRVSGSGGCNRFGGTYKLEGDQLSFSALVSTRMACAPEVMEKEQAYFDLLSRVRSVALAGHELELRDGDGKALASFMRE